MYAHRYDSRKWIRRKTKKLFVDILQIKGFVAGSNVVDLSSETE